MASVTYDHVVKRYTADVTVVKDFNVEIKDKEFMVLVGPSGCGKSTALRMLAGLEAITEGQIRIGDRVVNNVAAKDRDIAMVFQSYALYPHMSVYDNMAFPLQMQHMPKSEIDKRVKNASHILGLDNFLKRKPRALSGGQRQRVALGRAIVREPQAFLMDEPLSNLDAKLRTQMRAEISLLHKELGVTTIYVTHDQVEAMTLGERVAVMRRGELQQVAPPQELYDGPANLFVAGFIGSPSMNFVEGALESTDGGLSVVFGNERIAVDDKERADHHSLGDHLGKKVIVGIRPEHLEDAALAANGRPDRRLHGLVRLKEPLGSEIVVHFQIEAVPAVSPELSELEEVDESALLEQFDQQRKMRRTAFVGRFDVGTKVGENEQTEIAVASGALRFFDPETGQAIA